MIYECYKPKNTHEMREYILTVIDKSLRKLNKDKNVSESVKNYLGSAG